MPVENEDDVIGVCTECESDQPMGYMFNSPFAQAGQAVPCKYCGGVVVIVYREERDGSLKDSKNKRGV